MLDYFGMHAWLSRVPINEFTARLPRAVAVGVAAAGMIVLGKLVADRARRGSALWALYCLTLALAVVSFVYLGLLVFAHAVTLALGRNRRQLLPFEVAVAAALVLASPLIALAADQRLSWPGRRWCWSAGRPTGPAVPSRAAAFAHVDDLAAGVSGADAAQLWSEDLPLDSDIVKPRLAVCQVLWAVIDRTTPSPVMDAAERQGFAVHREWTLNRSIVVRLRRP